MVSRPRQDVLLSLEAAPRKCLWYVVPDAAWATAETGLSFLRNGTLRNADGPWTSLVNSSQAVPEILKPAGQWSRLGFLNGTGIDQAYFIGRDALSAVHLHYLIVAEPKDDSTKTTNNRENDVFDALAGSPYYNIRATKVSQSLVIPTTILPACLCPDRVILAQWGFLVHLALNGNGRPSRLLLCGVQAPFFVRSQLICTMIHETPYEAYPVPAARYGFGVRNHDTYDVFRTSHLYDPSSWPKPQMTPPPVPPLLPNTSGFNKSGLVRSSGGIAARHVFQYLHRDMCFTTLEGDLVSIQIWASSSSPVLDKP
ncbi:hypothetical protein SODALDRAFT_357031 [Sodiomyces alkalinus F11]|uniref:Uncharacterized protein n=1 Tax=Sodiomyces alkalinus (strain CBS 110278 / VKM F-3762 / F11) TaxID=1314773 RepID=A0A3N2Q314_SODAK|nr:hypothetical protein SODALDRAFT_357031 [Sodiomyces alkalinus F11]ROT41005.1 hypothetical protein SODALDRAFT_357031 [Sodiomyces alkalinus F11]